MRKSIGILMRSAALPVMLLLAPAAAQGADLVADNATVDDAKAHGIIGEQADGLLGVVRGDPDAGIMGAVAELNQLRNEAYRRDAGKSGTTPEEAGQKAGLSRIEKVSTGQYFKPRDGIWTKK